MTKDEFQKRRTEIISKMLDNPTETGIYPTTNCYNELDELYEILRQPLVINWVAITEKMPESGQCVLIYSKDGGVAEGAWIRDKGYFEQWRWNCVQKGVTHWAELPMPPCL